MNVAIYIAGGGTPALLLSKTVEPISQCLVNASALLEARFHESVKLGEVLRARSINPVEGGRWRFVLRHDVRSIAREASAAEAATS